MAPYIRLPFKLHFMNRIFSIVLFILAFSFLYGCSKRMVFSQSTLVPAAEGVVKVKKDNNGNYFIWIKVQNLAKPVDLYPARKTYVAWMESDSDGRRMLGNLKPASGLFSDKLKSSLQTVSPFKPVSVFITAEDELRPNYPTGPTVLRTR